MESGRELTKLFNTLLPQKICTEEARGGPCFALWVLKAKRVSFLRQSLGVW